MENERAMTMAAPYIRWLAVVAVLTGCPERAAPPERGTELRFSLTSDADEARDVIERRLAHAQVKARVFVDHDRVAVRVPASGDVELVREVMTRRGHFEVCAEDKRAGDEACGVKPSRGVEATNADGTCSLIGPTDEAVRAVLAEVAADAGIRLEPLSAGSVKGWLTTGECVPLNFVDVTSTLDEVAHQTSLRLSLDEATTTRLGDFTQKLLGQHALLMLDERVLAAPVVTQALRGKTLVVNLTQVSARQARAAAAALAGGRLEHVTFEREAKYGGPTFR